MADHYVARLYGSGIACLVLSLISLPLSLTLISNILGITLGAIIIAAHQTGTDAKTRAAALSNLGSVNCVAIALLVFTIIDIIVFGPVFFTVGIAVIRVHMALSGSTNNLAGVNTSYVSGLCATSQQCQNALAILGYLATLFTVSFVASVLRLVGVSLVMAYYNALNSIVAKQQQTAVPSVVVMSPMSAVPGAAPMAMSVGGTTIVSMPQQMVAGQYVPYTGAYIQQPQMTPGAQMVPVAQVVPAAQQPAPVPHSEPHSYVRDDPSVAPVPVPAPAPASSSASEPKTL